MTTTETIARHLLTWKQKTKAIDGGICPSCGKKRVVMRQTNEMFPALLRCKRCAHRVACYVEWEQKGRDRGGRYSLRDGEGLMPYANPADRKAYEGLRAKNRRAQGLCAHCSKPARKGMVQCADCAKRYAKPKGVK